MIEVIDEYHKAQFIAQGFAHFFIPQDEAEEEDAPEAKVVRSPRKTKPKTTTEGVETK